MYGRCTPFIQPENIYFNGIGKGAFADFNYIKKYIFFVCFPLFCTTVERKRNDNNNVAIVEQKTRPREMIKKEEKIFRWQKPTGLFSF